MTYKRVTGEERRLIWQWRQEVSDLVRHPLAPKVESVFKILGECAAHAGSADYHFDVRCSEFDVRRSPKLNPEPRTLVSENPAKRAFVASFIANYVDKVTDKARDKVFRSLNNVSSAHRPH